MSLEHILENKPPAGKEMTERIWTKTVAALTRPAGDGQLDPLDGRAEPSMESRVIELLKYIEARRPSNYAPWRDFEIREMAQILRGEGSPIDGGERQNPARRRCRIPRTSACS